MTALVLKDLTAKAEQSGKNTNSAFYSDKPYENKELTQKAEAELGRETYEKKVPPIRELFEQFSKYIFSTSPWIHKQLYISRLRLFVDFIEKTKDHFLPMTQTLLKEYQDHLLLYRGRDGLYLNAYSLLQHIRTVKNFYAWMARHKWTSKPLLNKINLEKELHPILTKHIEERRNAFLEAHYGKHTDEEILKLYLDHVEKHWNHALRVRNQNGLSHLMALLKSQGKRIQDWKNEDTDSILEVVCKKEKHPSVKRTQTTLRHHLGKISTFSTWLYQEGYHPENPFGAFTWERLAQAFKTHRSQETKSLKGRYYNVKAILKSYQKYLKEKYSHHMDMDNFLSGLRIYLRFLSSQKKTLYTATAETMEGFKKHLLNYEYFPKKYLLPKAQCEHLYRLKRFYDWFHYEGYVKEHLLKGLKLNAYEREIASLCQGRKEQNLSKPELTPSFTQVYQGITAHEQALNLAQGTIVWHQRGWRVFFTYLQNTNVLRVEDVNESVLNDYQIYLQTYRNEWGRKLSLMNKLRFLVAVKRLFNYLWKFKLLPGNPGLCIELPKTQRGLPTVGLTHREFLRVVDSIDTKTLKGIRDRAIFEMFYSTGMRSNELCHVQQEDIDFSGGLVRVNVPKGGLNFQRVIPIGDTALFWIKKYLEEVRSKIKPIPKEPCFLFWSMFKKPLFRQEMLHIVKNCVMKSGLKKRKVVTHSFRVTCATEMIRHNADIKYVQEQLGHRSIQSTEKYLRLMPSDLKKVHSKCHPRERGKQENDPSLTFESSAPTEKTTPIF
jgi:integrase/recombinase XerD